MIRGLLPLVTVLPVGSIFYMNGTLSMDILIMIIILSLGIMPPLITAFSYLDDIAKIGTIVGDISVILKQDDLMRAEKEISFSGYDIALRDVSFGYNRKQVLNDISLDIPAGTVTAFVGPSGGGKSTIARLIASLWDIDSGSITIGGKNIKDIPLDQLNDSIAYVSQDGFLFNDTVRNNIRISNHEATDREVEEAARASGCHQFIMQLDNGKIVQSGTHNSLVKQGGLYADFVSMRKKSIGWKLGVS